MVLRFLFPHHHPFLSLFMLHLNDPLAIVTLWYLCISGKSGQTHWVYLANSLYSSFRSVPWSERCQGISVSTVIMDTYYYILAASFCWRSSPSLLVACLFCGWRHHPLFQMFLWLEDRHSCVRLSLNLTLDSKKPVWGSTKGICFGGRRVIEVSLLQNFSVRVFKTQNPEQQYLWLPLHTAISRSGCFPWLHGLQWSLWYSCIF